MQIIIDQLRHDAIIVGVALYCHLPAASIHNFMAIFTIYLMVFVANVIGAKIEKQW